MLRGLGKLMKLLPALTTRHLPPSIRGKVYEACIRSAMLHGSKMWEQKETELQWLRRNYRAMIRWTCGIKDRDQTPSASLLQKLGIEDITSVLHCRRLWWYGNVQLTTSCIKYIRNFALLGTRKKERPRRTWSECVKTDVDMCGLAANPREWGTDSTLI